MMKTLEKNRLNGIHEHDLLPILDRAKSYYNKARIIYNIGANKASLMSYTTHVATIYINTGEIKVIGLYSRTTIRHIKDFIFQFTGKTYTTKEIEQLFM